MSDWQQDFTAAPAAALPPVNWQQDFTASQQQSDPSAGMMGQPLPGEELTNQIGLAGRDLAGAVPMGIATIGDLANIGINYATSSNLGMPTDYVQKALSATGLFPEYQNDTQRNVGSIASALFTGGEGLYNQAREGYANASDMLSNALGKDELPPDGGGSGGLVVPKSSDIKLIKDKLDLAGISPQQYADALMKSGPDDFAGELGGDPLRMQTQVQAKITGPAMQEARDAMRQRLAEAPQRTATIIGEYIKPEQNVQGMLQNIQDMNAQLPDLYKAADSDVVPRTPFLSQINTPAGQTAMKATVQKLANQGINPSDVGIVINQNTGFHGFSPQVPVSTVHEFSKSLGDLVERNPLTGAVEGSDSATIEGMRQGVTSALAENSDAFARANSVAAASKQAQSAFDMGRQLAKTSAGEKADAIMGRAEDVMSPNELSYQKAGYAQGLTDASQNTGLGTGGNAGKIATGKVQNSVGSILNDPTQAQKFADALMQEKNRIDLAQRGLGGSNTAETLDAGIPKVPGLMELGGHAVNAAKDWLTQSRNERLGQLLFATDPEQKVILAKKVLSK